MIRRSTWIMLALFVVALSAALLWERWLPVEEEATEEVPTPQAFWSATSSNITGFRVEENSAGTVVDVRRGAESVWMVLEPAGAVADAARIEQAASFLASPQPRSALPAREDLFAFGLEEPRARVTVYTVDGTSRGFTVGGEVPTGGAYYTMVAGKSEIFLMGKVALDDVLNLWQDLLPPTATTTATAAPTLTREPGPEGTPTPAEGSATPDGTPTP